MSVFFREADHFFARHVLRVHLNVDDRACDVLELFFQMREARQRTAPALIEQKALAKRAPAFDVNRIGKHGANLVRMSGREF